jgi:hypothetical protein
MGQIEIHTLSPKTVVMISKLVYKDHINNTIDLFDLNNSIKKLGIRTELNLDVSFIYEVIRLNEDKFNNDTITFENVILPKLKEVGVDYYRSYRETVTYYYHIDVKSFSKQKGIIDNFFNYEGDDGYDIDFMQSIDKDYSDSEYVDGGINDID